MPILRTIRPGPDWDMDRNMFMESDFLDLNRLLSPSSVALVGASERSGSIAANTFLQIRESGFTGNVYLVNPRYGTLFGLPCHPTLSALPEVPDLVVYAISGLALESSFDQALSLGVGGILIYAANHLQEDTSPSLPDRLRHKAGASGIPVCGGNSMGFYNYDHRKFISFDRPPERPAGHIALIAHSGSALTYLANNDARFCFNYVISTGQETNGTVADYMHHVLQQSTTRVIALFLEAVRDVPGFVRALELADERDIPVVIVKAGRTEKSAALALSHSGAIAGDHDAFSALCRRHHALLVRDIDELIATALLFALECRPATDAIASILDSGGMREQMLDLANDHGVAFATISSRTRNRISRQLDAGLIPDNPLDAMGALGRNSETVFTTCGKALLDDPATGLLTYEFEFRDGFSHYPELFHSLECLHQYRSKPVIAVNSFGFSDMRQTAAELCHQGIACLNGIDLTLRCIRNLMEYSRGRQRDDRPAEPSWQPDPVRMDYWKEALKEPGPKQESVCLALLDDFDFPVIPFRTADSLESTLLAAESLGYPIVLKTSADGVTHKSREGGVLLGLENPEALVRAYDTLSSKLGSRVLVMPLASPGMEVALGMKRDEQYGPLVMISAGGTLVEVLNDRAFGLVPIGTWEAKAMWQGLSIHHQIASTYGSSHPVQSELEDLLMRFSLLMADLGDVIVEMDMNPLIINPDGICIVDALLVSGP